MSVSDAASPARAADGRVPGRRGLATRKKLIDCTAKLLASTRYRDLKVTDITRAAGTSPATFYQYFVDIDEVVLAVAEDTAEHGRLLAEMVDGKKWKGRAGVATAEEIVDGFLDFWKANRPTLRVLDLLASEGDERFRKVRTTMLNAVTRALAGAIETTRGESTDDGVEPMAMAGTLVGMLALVSAYQSGFAHWDIPVDQVRNAMVRLVYWGVTQPKLPKR